MKPRLFISYRREDSEAAASALYRDLRERFEEGQVFLDHQQIRGGEDWQLRLRTELEAASVVFFVIGPGWLAARDPQSHQRRLDIEDDWVRLELEAALSGEAVVVPLLVRGQKPFRDSELRSELLERLFQKQVMNLRDPDWDDDIRDLVALLKERGLRERTREGAERGDVPAGAVVPLPPPDREPSPPGEPRDTASENHSTAPENKSGWLRDNAALIGVVLFIAIVLAWAQFYAIPRMDRAERLAQSATREFVEHFAAYDANAVAALTERPFFLGEDRFEDDTAVGARFARVFDYARTETESQSDSPSVRASAKLARWLAQQKARENTNIQAALQLETRVDLGSEKEEDRAGIPLPLVPLEDDAVRVTLRIALFDSDEFDVAYLYYSLRPDAAKLRGILFRKQLSSRGMMHEGPGDGRAVSARWWRTRLLNFHVSGRRPFSLAKMRHEEYEKSGTSVRLQSVLRVSSTSMTRTDAAERVTIRARATGPTQKRRLWPTAQINAFGSGSSVHLSLVNGASPLVSAVGIDQVP